MQQNFSNFTKKSSVKEFLFKWTIGSVINTNQKLKRIFKRPQFVTIGLVVAVLLFYFYLSFKVDSDIAVSAKHRKVDENVRISIPDSKVPYKKNQTQNVIGAKYDPAVVEESKNKVQDHVSNLFVKYFLRHSNNEFFYMPLLGHTPTRIMLNLKRSDEFPGIIQKLSENFYLVKNKYSNNTVCFCFQLVLNRPDITNPSDKNNLSIHLNFAFITHVDLNGFLLKDLIQGLLNGDDVALQIKAYIFDLSEFSTIITTTSYQSKLYNYEFMDIYEFLIMYGEPHVWNGKFTIDYSSYIKGETIESTIEFWN